MPQQIHDRRIGMALGSFIGDALALPVHWYYDRAAMQRDYGEVRDFLAPRNPHPDSILWRSEYIPPNSRGDILHEQAIYWGRRGIHYHQFLAAGDNTLNLQLARELIDSLASRGEYDKSDYLQRYLDFMLRPGRHRDTYVEECHRKFFTAYALGHAPHKCAGRDIHIGGLSHVGVLTAFLAQPVGEAVDTVRAHIELTHRSREVSAAAGALTRMLSAVAAGGGLRDAILELGSDWISRRKVDQWSREADDIVVGRRLSPACYIEDAFPASLYLAWKYADDFEAGLVANTNLGGDNCHRGAVVGALLGAACGVSGIPSRYQESLHDGLWLRARIDLAAQGFSYDTPAYFTAT